MVEELAFHGVRNAEDVATCLLGYDETTYPQGNDWPFTRFYLPQVFDSGYRLTDDAHVLWRAFEEAHNKACLPGRLEISMESFVRAVEIGLERASAETMIITVRTKRCGPTRCITAAMYRPVMPPVRCSLPPDQLELSRFPILSKDEEMLVPALGYVFDPK
jgi:hypothetical protein